MVRGNPQNWLPGESLVIRGGPGVGGERRPQRWWLGEALMVGEKAVGAGDQRRLLIRGGFGVGGWMWSEVLMVRETIGLENVIMVKGSPRFGVKSRP